MRPSVDESNGPKKHSNVFCTQAIGPKDYASMETKPNHDKNYLKLSEWKGEKQKQMIWYPRHNYWLPLGTKRSSSKWCMKSINGNRDPIRKEIQDTNVFNI